MDCHAVVTLSQRVCPNAPYMSEVDPSLTCSHGRTQVCLLSTALGQRARQGMHDTHRSAQCIGLEPTGCTSAPQRAPRAPIATLSCRLIARLVELGCRPTHDFEPVI